MLWVSEEYPSEDSLWLDDGNSIALKLLLKRLFSYFKDNYMPYYFIPSINILERVPVHISHKVVNLLSKIMIEPTNYLVRSKLKLVQKYLYSTYNTLMSVKELTELKSVDIFKMYFERPDLFTLMKDHAVNAKLDHRDRKVVNVCKLYSPFNFQGPGQCSTDVPLRYKIFGIDDM